MAKKFLGKVVENLGILALDIEGSEVEIGRDGMLVEQFAEEADLDLDITADIAPVLGARGVERGRVVIDTDGETGGAYFNRTRRR